MNDMQWKEIERVLKENDRCMKMLEYYDRTGKSPTKKVPKNFTIKQYNFDRLKSESERTGKPMSRLLDELIEKM
jgi:hypothetical protein